MPITTQSAQDANRDSSGARCAARKVPVFITDCGRPAHVLLRIEDYRRLAGPQQSLVELLEGCSVALANPFDRVPRRR